MSQCVPSWDLDGHPSSPTRNLSLNYHPYSSLHLAMSETDVAELTWEKGHLAMHGHRHESSVAKPIPKHPAIDHWAPNHKAGSNGTLESVIDHATSGAAPTPWPPLPLQLTPNPAPTCKRPRLGEPATGSQGSTTPEQRRESALLTAADDVGFTTASTTPTTSGSPSPGEEGGARSPDTENTSFGGRPLALDDHYYARHAQRAQQGRKRSAAAEEEKAGKGDETARSTISTKRSRASAVHNQSERKRRDRINEKIKTLQKLVPNSSKIDKASMLDEVIEYLKQLQAQVQMMNRMNSIPHMMMPMAMPPFQMSMMAHMAQMAQMGMGMGLGMMDMNPLAKAGHAAMPPTMMHPPTFFPLVGDHQLGGPAAPSDPFSAFMAGQTQQPMGMDAYKRMAAMYQHLHQQVPPANPRN